MSRFLIEVDPAWRNGRGRWWRANRRGYTDKLELAGIYDEAEAIDITKNSDRAEMVPVERETERLLGILRVLTEAVVPDFRARARELVGARPAELAEEWHEAKVDLLETALLEAYEAGRAS